MRLNETHNEWLDRHQNRGSVIRTHEELFGLWGRMMAYGKMRDDKQFFALPFLLKNSNRSVAWNGDPHIYWGDTAWIIKTTLSVRETGEDYVIKDQLLEHAQTIRDAFILSIGKPGNQVMNALGPGDVVFYQAAVRQNNGQWKIQPRVLNDGPALKRDAQHLYQVTHKGHTNQTVNWLMQRAEEYAAKRDFASAIEFNDRAIKLAPQNPGAHIARGNTFYNKADYLRAIVDYGTAIQIDPSNAAAYSARANSYLKVGDAARSSMDPLYGLAFSDLNHAIALNPADIASLIKRASYYVQFQENKLALEDLNHAVELGPKNVDAFVQRWLQRTRMQDSNAEEDYRHAVALDPKSVALANGVKIMASWNRAVAAENAARVRAGAQSNPAQHSPQAPGPGNSGTGTPAGFGGRGGTGPSMMIQNCFPKRCD